MMIEQRTPRFARWLTEPMLRNRGIYIKVALAAAVINVFGIVTSLFTMTVYDRVLPNNATSSLIALTVGLAIVVLFDFLLRTLRAYFTDIAGARIDEEVGEHVFGRLLAIRMDVRLGSTGSFAAMMREIETLRDFFASVTLTAVVDLPFIAITLTVLVLIGGPLVFVPLAMVPLVIIVALLAQPALDRLSRSAMQEGQIKQAVLVEAIGGLEMVKANNAAPLLSARWQAAVERQSQVSLSQRLVSAIAVNVAVIANTISYAGVVVAGVGMIANQNLTMGGLIACSILASRAIAPLGQIAQLMTRLTQTRTAYRQINGMLAHPSEGPAEKPLDIAEPMGLIELRKVSFRYPRQAEDALSEVSLRVRPGEKVAILGPMGSGKSTIARLVLGLYPAAAGLVLIDGIDLRQLNPTAYRARVGVALQESVLLSGTIRENIALGRAGVDDAALLRAAQLSGAHDFIGTMANGYDLTLTDRGESLSGGQRQAIALARALVERPRMLVFDEPTSAMDAQTEARLIKRLEVELVDRTLLLITHRPSMLRLVDRVIVMEAGKIIADGPRDTVLNQMTGKGASVQRAASNAHGASQGVPSADAWTFVTTPAPARTAKIIPPSRSTVK
ncbi:type I secretion system permease/ATPase [Blastomonas sp. AAP53]|uniref:type I secretion system permease/ATPase n=1 Tax=Blastomonas sp. AAP53 TaxID=1248760 RepID=UPI0002D956EC|nr:type I secretion system permease/ATPase [Blastomonas sp. AAP53]